MSRLEVFPNILKRRFQTKVKNIGIKINMVNKSSSRARVQP